MKVFGKDALVTSASSVVINPAHFMPLDEFGARVDRLIRQIKSSARATGVDEVYVAGELEFRCHAERSQNGIPLNEVVCYELGALAEEFRLPFALTRPDA